MQRRHFVVLTLAVALGAARAADAEPPQHGPSSGTLVLIGGGNPVRAGIVERFIELAGGRDKKIVIVPTALGSTYPDGSPRIYDAARTLAPWLRLGLRNVVMLHTLDPKVADSDEFSRVLDDASAVWFDGGRQWNLVDAYANTRTLQAFHAVLARGGVIAGTSAGATIQGDYLVRGDTAGPHIMMTSEPNHQEGFKFLRRSAVDQHVDARNRWNDLAPVIRRFPHLLGIGLAENAAIVVKGDRFEVIGTGKVAIHDGTRNEAAGQQPYILLSPGNVYDMQARALAPAW